MLVDGQHMGMGAGIGRRGEFVCTGGQAGQRPGARSCSTAAGACGIREMRVCELECRDGVLDAGVTLWMRCLVASGACAGTRGDRGSCGGDRAHGHKCVRRAMRPDAPRGQRTKRCTIGDMIVIMSGAVAYCVGAV